MFSDPSNFQVFKMGSTMVRRPKSSDHFVLRYTVPTVKHLASVMVWESFSEEKERGGIHFLPKNKKKMNADLYLEVLEKHMLNLCSTMALRCQCMMVHPVTKLKKW